MIKQRMGRMRRHGGEVQTLDTSGSQQSSESATKSNGAKLQKCSTVTGSKDHGPPTLVCALGHHPSGQYLPVVGLKDNQLLPVSLAASVLAQSLCTVTMSFSNSDSYTWILGAV